MTNANNGKKRKMAMEETSMIATKWRTEKMDWSCPEVTHSCEKSPRAEWRVGGQTDSDSIIMVSILLSFQ